MIKNILIVALGGSIGSVLRFLINTLISNKISSNKMIYATFIVNIVGCFIIGYLAGIFEKQSTISTTLKLLAITGFCGGFTTFSTFSIENYNLLQSGNYITSIIYITTSIFIGLLFVGLGLSLTK